jgi:NADH-quinone oxidoreductase subunit M
MPGVLTWLVLLPLLGATAAAAVDRRHERQIWAIAAAAATLTFVAAAWVWMRFVPGVAGLQFEEMAPWVPRVGMAYHLAVDGLSVSLVALTALLFPLALIAAPAQVTARVKAFVITLLLLEAGLLGTFLAQDLVLFYVFWEGMLVPMYFLIGLWGGPARGAAAIKFLIYTMAGSVLMLLAIVAVYWRSSAGAPGGATFDLPALLMRHAGAGGRLGQVLFLAFAAAFAIKMPVWPFHTWLPDAYTEAPPVVTVLLASLMAKAGAYGFVRFCLPLFPEAMRTFGPLVSALAVAGILYGGAVAWAQGDLRRLLAYGSMSHMGFILLGIFAFNVAAIQGSLIQMINHGISTGALFLIAGMLLDRTGRARTDQYGGVAAITPALAAVTLIVTVSSLALPGTNGFVGEFLILAGTFQARPVYAVLATFGVVVTAAYLLAFVGRIFHGAPRADLVSMVDLRGREIAVLAPLVAVIFWVGLYPQPLLERSDAAVRSLLRGASVAVVETAPPGSAGPAPAGSAPGVAARRAAEATATTEGAPPAGRMPP